MPIISVFFGIIVRINFADHNPPHLHAEYQDAEALFDLATGMVIAGQLPRRQARLVTNWIIANRQALAENWRRAHDKKPTFKIDGPHQG